jgi:hypothetical protein
MAPAVPTTPTLYMLVVHWMQGMTGEGGRGEGWVSTLRVWTRAGRTLRED